MTNILIPLSQPPDLFRIGEGFGGSCKIWTRKLLSELKKRNVALVDKGLRRVREADPIYYEYSVPCPKSYPHDCSGPSEHKEITGYYGVTKAEHESYASYLAILRDSALFMLNRRFLFEISENNMPLITEDCNHKENMFLDTLVNGDQLIDIVNSGLDTRSARDNYRGEFDRCTQDIKEYATEFLRGAEIGSKYITKERTKIIPKIFEMMVKGRTGKNPRSEIEFFNNVRAVNPLIVHCPQKKEEYF